MKKWMIVVIGCLVVGCTGSSGSDDAGAEDGDGGNGDVDEVAVGFVTVMEYQSGWGDYSEVRAYFAENLHPRKAPYYHDTELLSAKSREGACVLYGSYRRLLDLCDPPCGMDQYCDGMTCQGYPAHWNVGPMEITGLKTRAFLEPDEYDNYLEQSYPADLFDAGAGITVSAAGGELGAFELSATGVAPLDVASTVDLIAGKPTTISWTPGAIDARVQVFLRTGIHRPALPAAAVFCDVPDSAGQIVIPATLVDVFRKAAGLNQQPCELMRYTQDVQTPFGGQVELRVANVVNLQLNTP
jgi:hypothetical protein